jgi:hypothetical protein
MSIVKKPAMRLMTTAKLEFLRKEGLDMGVSHVLCRIGPVDDGTYSSFRPSFTSRNVYYSREKSYDACDSRVEVLASEAVGS